MSSHLARRSSGNIATRFHVKLVDALTFSMLSKDTLKDVFILKFIFIIRYNIIFMVLTYVIPVVTMGVSYSLMSHVLWRAKGIGELNQRQAESIQSKRKVSTIVILRINIYIKNKTLSDHVPSLIFCLN